MKTQEAKPSEAEDKVWICNECNFPNFTQSVSEDEIDAEVLSCINCGGFEFHLGKKIAGLGK